MNPARISPFPVPCAVWAHRLAALHPNDLAPHEQGALQDHLAHCSACAAVFAAYQAMDASLLSLPAVQPSAQQAAHLAALIDDQTSSESRWKPVTNRQEHCAPPARQPDRLTQLARRMSLLAAALVVILLAGSACVLFAPRHPPVTGTRTSPTLYAVSATGTVSAIAASNGKNIWSTPLHIRPSEQFLVSGQRIFLGSSDYFLYALQASNGRLLWQRSYKDLTTIGPQTVEIAPYPASDEKAIYFGTPKGIYVWRASDGQPIWQYSTPAACGTQGGICAPEVETVNTGVVYAYLDGLYALDATDGSLLWHDSNVSRTLLAVAQNHVYVAAYGGARNHAGPMRVLQADTGQVLNTPGFPRISPDEMITDGERIYLRGGDVRNHEDVYALQGSDNTVLWHRQYNSLVFSGAHDGSLYTFSPLPPGASASNQRPFCARSAEDGSTRWCQPLPGDAMIQLAVVSQRTLYVSTMQGVEAIRIGDGTVLWTAFENIPLDHIEMV